MGPFAASGELDLPGVGLAETAFNNLNIVSGRVFTFANGADNYGIYLREKINGLSPKISLRMKVAGFDAEVLLGEVPDFCAVDGRFADVDAMLFGEDVRAMLLACIFDGVFKAFTANSGLDIRLDAACFGNIIGQPHDTEIGVTISKNEAAGTTVNVRLNHDLLDTLNEKFEKIPMVHTGLADDFPFEWHLEIGKTELSAAEIRTLDWCDIVFLDDDSAIKSGKFAIKGLESLGLRGRLHGCDLVVESGNFKK
jgi:hypothetical protein